MDYDSLKDAQSGLGTGAVIVMNKQTDIVEAISRFAKVRLMLEEITGPNVLYSSINMNPAGNARHAEKARHG